MRLELFELRWSNGKRGVSLQAAFGLVMLIFTTAIGGIFGSFKIRVGNGPGREARLQKGYPA